MSFKFLIFVLLFGNVAVAQVAYSSAENVAIRCLLLKIPVPNTVSSEVMDAKAKYLVAHAFGFPEPSEPVGLTTLAKMTDGTPAVRCLESAFPFANGRDEKFRHFRDNIFVDARQRLEALESETTRVLLGTIESADVRDGKILSFSDPSLVNTVAQIEAGLVAPYAAAAIYAAIFYCLENYSYPSPPHSWADVVENQK